MKKTGLLVNKSRVRRKLLLYFILIAIVSISVSAEIILEMSSPKIQTEIQNNITVELTKHLPSDKVNSVSNSLIAEVYRPLMKLRGRMFLLLIVVTCSITAAFHLFIKDIVTPLDTIVSTTKSIAEGDLTLTIPVTGEDEIGQIATLINSMNIHYQDLFLDLKKKIDRQLDTTIEDKENLHELIRELNLNDVVLFKKIKASQLKAIQKHSRRSLSLLEKSIADLMDLQSSVSRYKTFSVKNDISLNDINPRLEIWE